MSLVLGASGAERMIIEKEIPAVLLVHMIGMSAECYPQKILKNVQKQKRQGGRDGMKGKRAADGICFHWCDTGKCPYGPPCKFKHPPKIKGAKAVADMQRK